MPETVAVVECPECQMKCAGCIAAAACLALALGPSLAGAQQPDFTNCKEPTNMFNVSGSLRSTPCAGFTLSVMSAGGGQFLWACGGDDVMRCDGDGSGPGPASCRPVGMLGSSSVADLALSAARDALYAACGTEVRRCAWDAAAGAASGCAVLAGAQCPGSGGEDGVALQGGALVLGCSSPRRAANGGVLICPLAAGGAALNGSCAKLGEDPCGSANGQRSFRNSALSLGAQGGLTAGCTDSPAYCSAFSTAAGPSGCAATAQAPPCPWDTMGIARLPSGQTAVSCDFDGVRLCGSRYPSTAPSAAPSDSPSAPPTGPTAAPTALPSGAPSGLPSGAPSGQPSGMPSAVPSNPPSAGPSSAPTSAPTLLPSGNPSGHPSVSPSLNPSAAPSPPPSPQPSAPPSAGPSQPPTRAPTAHPTAPPTALPSASPTGPPTKHPSPPTHRPSTQPTTLPAQHPTSFPNGPPTLSPSHNPSLSPSVPPSVGPSAAPAQQPAPSPSVPPSHMPTVRPSLQPTVQPTVQPTGQPTVQPTAQPTVRPSASPRLTPAPGGTQRCAAVICVASDICHRRGSCSDRTGLCSDPPAPDGTVCNDGDDQTAGDSCAAGVCSGELRCRAANCVPCDARCSKSVCNVATGECAEANTADGIACNDADLTTITDSCVQGLCIGTPDRCLGQRCPPVSQCHTFGVCNPATGRCSEPRAPDGTACSDNVAQTVDDKCLGGSCVGLLSCGNNTCESSRGGLLEPACYVPRCSSDGLACAFPEERPYGTVCSDGRADTTNDTCQLGQCVGEADLCAGMRCPPPSPCHGMGQCDAATGVCADRPLPDGAPCDDGDDDTHEDSCAAGGCSGWAACKATEQGRCPSLPSPCLRSGCGATGCVVLLRDCAPCSDGDPGTAGDMCRGGACRGAPINGSRTGAVPGTIIIASRRSYRAKELSTTGFTVLIQLSGDRFTNLGAAQLRCGLHGDSAAGVWLNGTRAAVADACSAEVQSDRQLAVDCRAGADLVPKRAETVLISIQPGVVRSGLAPLGTAAFELVPWPLNVPFLLIGYPPIMPGAASLAVKLQQCSDDMKPEPELDRLTNPLALRLGDSDVAAYQGALVGLVVIICSMGTACLALYCILWCRGRDRMTAGGAGLASIRLLAAARFGPMMFPLTFAFPIGASVGTMVLHRGETAAYRTLAGSVLLLCAAFPIFTAWAVRKADRIAKLVEAETQSTIDLLFSGRQSWEPAGPPYYHRVFGMLYSAYTHRDRYLMVADLLLNLAIGALQGILPQTEAQCKVQSYAILALLVVFAGWVTARRSYLSPYEMACALLLAWGEAACKFLLTVFGYGQHEGHWALSVSGAIMQGLSLLIMAKTLIDIGLFLYGEYCLWAELPGGGRQHSGKVGRILSFCTYWFFFIGVMRILAEDAEPQAEEDGDDSDLQLGMSFADLSLPGAGRGLTRSPLSPVTPGAGSGFGDPIRMEFRGRGSSAPRGAAERALSQTLTPGRMRRGAAPWGPVGYRSPAALRRQPDYLRRQRPRLGHPAARSIQKLEPLGDSMLRPSRHRAGTFQEGGSPLGDAYNMQGGSPSPARRHGAGRHLAGSSLGRSRLGASGNSPTLAERMRMRQRAGTVDELLGGRQQGASPRQRVPVRLQPLLE